MAFGSATPRGFGLLEAIVALTLLAGTGAAVFAWISQNLRDLARIEESQAKSALVLNAHAILAGFNPFVTPSGERRLNGLRINWKSTLVEPMRPSVPFTGGPSLRWQAGLYRVDVQAVDEGTGLRTEFSVEQVGLEHVESVKPKGDQTP